MSKASDLVKLKMNGTFQLAENEGEKSIAYLTDSGELRILTHYKCDLVTHARALKLRDWLTETFDEVEK